MEEEKKEEDIQATSQVSSMQEGYFGDSSEDQMPEIEIQLKKAQDTLRSLQKIKDQLEKDRKNKMKLAEAEQQIATSRKLKEENEKLKGELKDYQQEINSLNDVIAAFKNDLLQTAEQLQNRVSDSLRKIGQGDNGTSQRVEHYARPVRHHRVMHHQIESNSDETKKTEKPASQSGFFAQLSPANDQKNFSTNKIQTDEAATKHQETAASNPVVSEQSIASVNSVAEQSKSEIAATPVAENQSNAPAITPVSETASTVVQSANSPAEDTAPEIKSASENIPAQENKPVAETTAVPESASVSVATPAAESAPSTIAEAPIDTATVISNATPAQDDSQTVPTKTEADIKESSSISDLNEYEEIKRELEALEKESVFSSDENYQKSTEENTEGTKSQESAETISASKNLFTKLLRRKPKSPAVPEAVKSIKVEPELAPANGQEFKQQFWQGAQVQQTEKAEAAASTTKAVENVASAPLQATQLPADNIEPVPAQQLTTTQQDQTQSVNTNAEPPQDSKASSNQIKKLSSVFSKKKKKVAKKIVHDDQAHKEEKHKGGGIGKLAIRAAVILLLATSGVVAFKLKNADQLREMYTSKATEAVKQAAEQTSKAPDGFSSSPAEQKYAEAYTEASFENTLWTEYNDSELGIKLVYPQNTSFRLKPVGSVNLWFLRRNGYLLKVERIETEQSVDEMAKNISEQVDYKLESMNIQNYSTIHMILQENLPVRGNMYLVKVDNTIFKIWYKTFLPGEDPDDEKRVRKMLDSLQFIKNG